MEEVINKIGYPDANVGSGIVVHRYETEDGIEFFISYMNETDAQMRVVNIYYGGSQCETKQKTAMCVNYTMDNDFCIDLLDRSLCVEIS